jgi:hypothetical protein
MWPHAAARYQFQRVIELDLSSDDKNDVLKLAVRQEDVSRATEGPSVVADHLL